MSKGKPAVIQESWDGEWFISTDTPGATVELVELADGVLAELNGAGSIVALVYPYGIDDSVLR